jgi:hypothetical protein
VLPSAGADQVDRRQTQKQRDCRDDLKVQNCLAADAAHRLDIPRRGNAIDQRCKQQRRDDALDQLQEYVAGRRQLLGHAGSRHADQHSHGHRNKDPAGARNTA